MSGRSPAMFSERETSASRSNSSSRKTLKRTRSRNGRSRYSSARVVRRRSPERISACGKQGKTPYGAVAAPRVGFQRVSESSLGCHRLPGGAPGVPGLAAQPLESGRQEAPVEPGERHTPRPARARREPVGAPAPRRRARPRGVRGRRRPPRAPQARTRTKATSWSPLRGVRELGSGGGGSGVVVIAEQRRESMVAVGDGSCCRRHRARSRLWTRFSAELLRALVLAAVK